MEFRDLGEKRFIQRPVIDVDDLDAANSTLKGEFDVQLERISGIDQNGVTGEGVLSQCLLEGVDLTSSRLFPLTLDDVTMRRVTLNNSQWTKVGARRVEFESCQAIGWNFGCGLASHLYGSDCQFDYARLTIERTKGFVCFEDCSFRDATIRGSLANVVFINCTFEGAEFQVTDANGCDLSSSQLSGARGLLSLRGARITTTQTVDIGEALARESGFVVTRT